MEENTQVRVDNWGVFFLQRLQQFFNKTDYCDLTLQFQGNVQLKVHRLVLNACTEYFELLEHSDRLIEDSVILMPETLQADVVVPIINFMYTGMLEYPPSIYSRLCQAADLMHISVLNKLLDAQKPAVTKPEKIVKPKVKEVKSDMGFNAYPQVKKASPKPVASDPSPNYTSRKLTGWKRKTTASSSNSCFSRSDSIRTNDPLALDEAKPTRFEWPEDDLDLPNLDMMDISGFGDISYNSKPLLREDEVKPIINKSSFQNKNAKDAIHEIQFEDKSNHETARNGTEKRKAEGVIDKSPKRIRIVETENDTTISVMANENSSNFDPTKIVSEILRKYPHLVKKKKNIKLKIVAKKNEIEMPKAFSPVEKPVEKAPAKAVIRKTTVYKPDPPKTVAKDNVWTCTECTTHGEPTEFMLYYLYRKHMTDLHNTKFDTRICRYCGIAFSRNDRLTYHLFTKHGIKPSGNQTFPSCPQCPYVALTKEELQIHRNKHKKSEMQCTCCKLAFISPEAISGHIQITGHMGKTNKNVFDCQYCTKSSQCAISLLSHIKSNHEAEGKRDGIVSLDEIDLEEGDDLLEEPIEEPVPQEYIVSETQKNKVKIISDVTVPVSKPKTTTESVTLDQTKSHVSVPTSIATSLGLLDIVVLDENQQFILHNQAQQTGNNRTEYILPQIDTRNVTAEGLPSNDELVMVLTDQDYKDGHSGIATENSNIVVLYSHPADGQQGQFITSQGNLMVNSETGMLEIRNGAAIATTSSNQIVVSTPPENHIETIEMIQREIEEGHDSKQEEFYGDDKSKVLEQSKELVHYESSTPKDTTENSVRIDEIRKAGTEESVAEEIPTPNIPVLEETPEEHNSSISTVVETEPASSTEAADESIETEISEQCGTECKNSDAMEIDDSGLVEECSTLPMEDMSTSVTEEEQITDSENKDETIISENTEEEETHTEESPNEKPLEDEKAVGQCLDGEKAVGQCLDTERAVKQCSDGEKAVEQCFDSEQDIPMEIDEEDESNEDANQNSAVKDAQDDGTTEPESSKEIENSQEKSAPVASLKDEERPYSPTDHPVDMDSEIDHLSDKLDTESLNENDLEITECDKGVQIQESMVSSQSSQIVGEEDTQDKQSEGTKESTTMSILDDWEDTDSQQSDNKIKAIVKGAQETVHKLMDDWDEEEVEK